MTWFLIFAPIIVLLVWYFCRKIIFKYLLEPFHIHKRLLYPFDLFIIAPLILRSFYRMNTDLYSPFIGGILSINYFLLGLLWIIIFYGFIYFFIEKKWDKDKNYYNPSRRLFLKKNIAFSGYGVLGAVSSIGAYQSFNPVIEKIQIPLTKNHSALSGLTITQISDLHIGATLKKNFVQSVVEQVNFLDSDIVVITGDLADGTPQSLKDDLDPLSGIKSRQGVFYVNGNHEFYWGIDAWMEYLPSLGFTVLNNENKILNFNHSQFCIAGVNDFVAPRFSKTYTFDPIKSLKGVDNSLFKIMLTHRPRSFPYTHPLGVNLQLSGHTHGGQGYPWNFIVGLIQPYLAGLYDHNGMWIYVNRGTGFWGPPNRLGIPSEITHITLT